VFDRRRECDLFGVWRKFRVYRIEYPDREVFRRVKSLKKDTENFTQQQDARFYGETIVKQEAIRLC
jgi:hypothetical protein